MSRKNAVPRLKLKHLSPKFWAGCATAFDQFHTDGLHLSHAQPRCSVSIGIPYFCDWKPGRFRTTNLIR